MLRQMREGDEAYFYHSSCGKSAGIYGTVVVTRTAYPDLSALDPSSKYYDAKAKADEDKWSCIDVRLIEKWSRPLLLSTLKSDPALTGMQVNPHPSDVLICITLYANLGRYTGEKW